VAESIAIVSVVSTAAVGLGVPLINSRLERNRFRLESNKERADEIRSVLDSAAQAVVGALKPLAVLVPAGVPEPTEAQPPGWTPEMSSVLDEFEAAYIEVGRQQRRLAVRLGSDSPVVLAYGLLVTQIGLLYNALEVSRAENKELDLNQLRAKRPKLFDIEEAFHDEAANLLRPASDS